MKLTRKFQIGSQILLAKWKGKKRPLAVGWSLTKRCNFNCQYCGSSKRIGPEMSKEQLMTLAQQIVDAGVLKVAFTGGEPLLNPAILDIVPFLTGHGLSVSIDTNGKLLPEMIDNLPGLDGVLLSLDGPKEVNDLIRGEGAFDACMQAMEAAQNRKLRVVLTCVLSRWNLDTIEEVLKIARQKKVVVQFQPATGTLLGVLEENPGTPKVDNYRNALDRLIGFKKGTYSKEIGNSFSGLTHLRRWPEPVMVKCISGLIASRIEPDGNMYHCGRVISKTKNPPNVLDEGFRAAFEKLQVFNCPDCWCAQRLELLLASELSWSVLRNLISIY